MNKTTILYAYMVETCRFYFIFIFLSLILFCKVSHGCLYGIGILVAILLLGMSIYGIIFSIPLGQVQILIENSFK